VPEKSRRPKVEEYLAKQRRFEHLVDRTGKVVAGHEAEVAALQDYADRNVLRLERLAGGT
jgi:hypothetical protein